MTPDEVQPAVIEFLKTYRGAQALRVMVVADDPISPRSPGQPLTEGRVAGRIQDDGSVLLVTNALHDRNDVWLTLRHEIIGHYGIGRILGKRYEQFLRALLAAEDADPHIQKLGHEVRARYPNADEMTLAKEMLALAAERNIKRGFLRQLWGHIRRALREVGLVRGPITLDEVTALVSDSEKSLMRATASPLMYPPWRAGLDPHHPGLVEVVRHVTPAVADAQYSRRPPRFYSALVRNIEALDQPKAAPAHWQAVIANLARKGVKQEEVVITRILQWLDQQPGSVGKSQILEETRRRTLNLTEVINSGPFVRDDDNDSDVTIEKMDDGRYAAFLLPDTTNPIATGDTFADAEQNAIEYLQRAGITRYADRTLPGGTNYRELLLILPNIGDGQNTVSFRSPHFPDPNVLAHIRLTDRTDRDGNRLLFVEEIQSDWHQTGRHRGYNDSDRAAELNEKRSVLGQQIGEQVTRADQAGINITGTLEFGMVFYDRNPPESLGAYPAIAHVAPDRDLTFHIEATPTQRDIIRRYIDLRREHWKIASQLSRAGTAVPDAPFKKTWHELCLKRVLAYAAEHGYDRIGWTTGTQQLDRYHLSKRIHEIRVGTKRVGSLWMSLVALDPEGTPVLERCVRQIEDLSADIGIEGAAALAESQWTFDDASREYVKRVTGLDVTVDNPGARGLRALYDEMIPAFLSKYTKKWGIGVTTSILPCTREINELNHPTWPAGTALQVPTVAISHAMREYLVWHGQPLFRLASGHTNAEADSVPAATIEQDDSPSP